MWLVKTSRRCIQTRHSDSLQAIVIVLNLVSRAAATMAVTPADRRIPAIPAILAIPAIPVIPAMTSTIVFPIRPDHPSRVPVRGHPDHPDRSREIADDV